MHFAIIEIGSTTTKAYFCENSTLTSLGKKVIPFKMNFKQNNHLASTDIESLHNFIEEIKEKTEEIYAYGTSIFRKLSKEELEEFTTTLSEKYGVHFEVVSSDEENEYTVKGVLANNNYNGRLTVAIGGGGSTEIALVENKKIIKKVNLDFGAVDITEKFPDLGENITTTSFEKILDYTKSLITDLDFKSDILVLAGGDYIYFYETVGYKMSSNKLYEDPLQPYLIDSKLSAEYDKDILTKSLDEIKEREKDNALWWNGARGMRFCMHAISDKIEAKYIIPTRINMIIGLAAKIKNMKEH